MKKQGTAWKRMITNESRSYSVARPQIMVNVDHALA